MPSYLRPCAIIGIILCTSLLAVISASLSAISNPNGHQTAVQHVNTTGKLADCAHRPSGLKSQSFLAPLFRNAFIGSVHIDSNSYFDLVARAGGCECSDINNECCTPTISSEAPFCRPSSSICCTNTFCVETETCCGDGGCCPANTTCFAKPNGLGCCPHGDFCSEPAVCYDYTSTNCSGTATPSPQCCPPDLPFCNSSEQAGYGCYATSATGASGTASTKVSTITSKVDLISTSSLYTSLTKTVTVAIISNPTGGLKLEFPTLSRTSQPQENGEVTKYVLSNGAALSLESDPDSRQTDTASFLVTGTVSPISSQATTSYAPTISSKTVISASSPPVSPPPNSRTTTGTAEFPLATTITTSKSPPILAPFRLVIDHPFVFLLLCVPWASLLAHEQFPGLLLEPGLLILTLVWISFTFVWILANIMYLLSCMIFCLKSLFEMLVPAPVTSERRAEEEKKEEEKEGKKEEEEANKTRQMKLEASREPNVNFSELKVSLLRQRTGVYERERERLQRSLEIRQREVEEREEEEEKKMEKKRKEEENKARQINTEPNRQPSVNFSELKVSLLRQRTEVYERERERLEQSLNIKQRELEEREENNRKIEKRRQEALRMIQQQQLQRPQGMDMGLEAPELKYVIVEDEERSREENARRKQEKEDEERSREDKARRRQEKVRRRHEEVRRRQERVMDQGGLLRTAFFP